MSITDDIRCKITGRHMRYEYAVLDADGNETGATGVWEPLGDDEAYPVGSIIHVYLTGSLLAVDYPKDDES